MRVTLQDVAAAADVSTATVSFFLNKPAAVRPETAARIKSAIDELGYVRNSAASQLRSGSSRMLAFIGFDVSDPHFAAVARGARQEAADRGLSLVLADADGARQTEIDYLRLFEEQRVRGVLLASADDPTDYLAERAGGGPVVLVGHDDPGARYPSVSVDNVAGGRLVGSHLAALGRRRVAFVGGPTSIPQVSDRLAGLRESSDGQVTVVPTGDRTVRAGRAAGDWFLSLPREERPDAIFAVNDLVALGLLHRLVVDGSCRIPQDVAIVGFNDTESDEYPVIPLTSVRVPQDDIGRTAVRLLAELADGPVSEPRQVKLQPELIVRTSTAGLLDDH